MILKEMEVQDHLSCQIQSSYRPFDIYGEYIMRKVTARWKGGIVLGVMNIFNLRYADNTVLFSNTGDELLTILRKLDIESNYLGHEIIYSETKISHRLIQKFPPRTYKSYEYSRFFYHWQTGHNS